MFDCNFQFCSVCSFVINFAVLYRQMPGIINIYSNIDSIVVTQDHHGFFVSAIRKHSAHNTD